MPSTTSNSNSNSSSNKQHGVEFLLETETTELQKETQDECLPFFQSLSNLPPLQLRHLESIGLLAAATDYEEEKNDGSDNVADNHDDDNDNDGSKSRVCLLYDAHLQYLSTALQVEQWPQLKSSFVSLDASRPWIMYWTLHSLDLMNRIENDGNNSQEKRLCACVDTLRACFTKRTMIVETTAATSNNEQVVVCGGFGGGPGQMAHMAPTYAAVMCLAMIATQRCCGTQSVDPDDQSSSSASAAASSGAATSKEAALQLLCDIRPPLYNFIKSLQTKQGGFCIHHDGEQDVRATYTVVSVAKLLHLWTPTLQQAHQQRQQKVPATAEDGAVSVSQSSVVDFLCACQTYEGGFGGEPNGSEAHGGYTYCALAALELLQSVEKCNLQALRDWLARRQMSLEGGFNGRCNKLVDGCYSFWQGGALAIVSSYFSNAAANTMEQKDKVNDDNHADKRFFLCDEAMLQRYILLCAQDVNGGLRDKPSKPRDFYHSCYNLSGLSVSQHYGNLEYGHLRKSRVAKTDVCFNIRVERVKAIQEYFRSHNISSSSNNASVVVMEDE